MSWVLTGVDILVLKRSQAHSLSMIASALQLEGGWADVTGLWRKKVPPPAPPVSCASWRIEKRLYPHNTISGCISLIFSNQTVHVSEGPARCHMVLYAHFNQLQTLKRDLILFTYQLIQFQGIPALTTKLRNMLNAVKLQHRLIQFCRALIKFTLTAKQSSTESIDVQSDDYNLYVNTGKANRVCFSIFNLLYCSSSLCLIQNINFSFPKR